MSHLVRPGLLALFPLLTLGLGAALAASDASERHWPQWRGPRGDGVAGEGPLPCDRRNRHRGGVARRAKFAAILTQSAPPGLRWHYEPMPEEKHSTIYHPAALKAFRRLFKVP